MQTLDSLGLQTLIEQIQSQTIRKYEYHNVLAAGNDNTTGSVLYISAIPVSDTTPWIIKYRVHSTIPTNDNTTQFAEVTLGGINSTIAYFNTSNIVYDLGQVSANSHIILTNDQKKIYIGLNLQDTYNEEHDIYIELQYFKNCDVKVLKKIKKISDIISDDDLSRCILKEIDFTKNGILSSLSANITDQLAAVATSGSYNDLKDKPQLAQIATSGSFNDLLDKPQLFSVSLGEGENLKFDYI